MTIEKNMIWEQRCYHFLENKYREQFENILKKNVIDKMYTSSKINFIDYHFDGTTKKERASK